MGEYMEMVPEEIRGHIRQITRTSGLGDTEDAVEMIAKGWLEKKALFENQAADMDMEEIDSLERADERGCLAMTYSGSLLNIGPLKEEGRNVQYASIGLRQDVPEAASKENSRLGGDVSVGQPVTFDPGPIQSSSPIFKIAVASDDLDVEEQEEQITRATLILTEEFVEINKELELE
jgi:hypothetical protein